MSLPRELQSVVLLTRQMRQQAEAQQWEQVQLLEEQRRPLISAAFPVRHPIADPSAVAEAIREIIELDRQTMELGSGLKQEMGNLLGQINQGRHATRAYRAVAR